MRTPTEIATEARELMDTANTAFVPASLVKIAELSVEFMESVAMLIDEAAAPALKARSTKPAA